MKLIKSLVVAGAVAFAMGALQANAQSLPSAPFPLTYQFEPLSISLSVTAQALLNTNASNTNVTVSTFKTEKITTQSILKALEACYNTNWPTGAKLALDLQSGDVFVVDKTGKNPIVDVSEVVDTSSNYVNVSFGPYNPVSDYAVIGDRFQHGPIVERQTTSVPVELYISLYATGRVSFGFDVYGIDTSVFKATATTASQTDNANIWGYGGVWDSNATAQGQVSGSGAWKAAAE